MSTQIHIDKLNKHKRYLLVNSDVYGNSYITNEKVNTPIEEIAKRKSRMLLPQIDAITSSCLDQDDLLLKFDLYDYKTSSNVNIQYQSKGETKILPVMYNDELLKRISFQSTNKVVKNQDTDMAFKNMKEKLINNENNVINQLLYSNFYVSDPKVRTILTHALNNPSSQINFNLLHGLIHEHYKQWRTFYFHTTDHVKPYIKK